MQTSFNVSLTLQDGSFFKQRFNACAPDLLELILAHVIALKQPVVFIDHYASSLDVSVKNIEIPSFISLSQVELSDLNESINGHIAAQHQRGLHKQFKIVLTCRRLLQDSSVQVDIGVLLNKFNLRAKYANNELALKSWGLSYIIHRLLKCTKVANDSTRNIMYSRYSQPDMPYSILKKLFNGE